MRTSSFLGESTCTGVAEESRPVSALQGSRASTSAFILVVVTLRVPPSGRIGLHLRVSRAIEPFYEPQLLTHFAKTASMLLSRIEVE